MRLIIFLLLIIYTPLVVKGQKDVKKQGDIYFEVQKYKEALKYYKEYNSIDKNPSLLIRRGLCYLKTNKPDACLSDLAKADQLKSIDNIRLKYAATAYFVKSNYVEAARLYKLYLNYLKPGREEFDLTVKQIKICGQAKNVKFQKQLAFVENLGADINTEYDEYAPVQSPTKSGRLYFSSARENCIGGLRGKDGLEDVVRGKYASDMFSADLISGNWSSVAIFERLLNSPKDEKLEDFSPDGSILYYSKSIDEISNVLYSDTFSIDRDPTKLPTEAVLPFDGGNGDRDLFVFSDSLVVFSSKRLGGFGGYDIYYAQKVDSIWLMPVNLGPSINSSDNEVSPKFTKNGRKLYFSSDRIVSLGGYDIFVSELQDNRHWTTPTNLGFPINSPRDDMNFEVSSDGMSAYFDSDRIESLGGKDLYVAYFKDQIIDQLDFIDVPAFVQVEQDTIAKVEELVVTTPANTLPPKDYIVRPLFFNDNDDVLNPTNVDQIKRLAFTLKTYPEIRILLTSHFISENNPAPDVFYSVKRAEKVFDMLTQEGIAKSRIDIQGCGANYPLALPMINGIPSTLANKNNKRIDIAFYKYQNTNLKISYDNPAVASAFRDVLWDNFVEKNNGVTFRVKFAKVSQMLREVWMQGANDIIIEKKGAESTFEYTLGNETSFADAERLRIDLFDKGYEESEIVPYYQGSVLDRIKVLSLIGQYPELEYYIKQ